MVSKSRKHYLLLLPSNKAMHLKIMHSNVINSIVTGAVIDPNTTTQLLGKIDKFFCTIKSIFASCFFFFINFSIYITFNFSILCIYLLHKAKYRLRMDQFLLSIDNSDFNYLFDHVSEFQLAITDNYLIKS